MRDSPVPSARNTEAPNGVIVNPETVIVGVDVAFSPARNWSATSTRPDPVMLIAASPLFPRNRSAPLPTMKSASSSLTFNVPELPASSPTITVAFDVIVRYLRHLGYSVKYVQNLTDVGHLVDNSEEGEDKVERQARIDRVHPLEIAEAVTRG